MTLWKKKDNSSTLEEVIEKNTGMNINEFLHPKREPYLMNLDKIVEFLKRARQNKTYDTVFIFGDYDCDGVTSSTILYATLSKFFGVDATVKVRLPRRMSEGYGISMTAIDEVQPGWLVITVDNGIAAIDPIQAARNKGCDVLVIDHHMPRGDGLIPNCNILLDPHQLNDDSEFDGYCGAGLAYRLAQKLFPSDSEFLTKMVALAGIGTVADVMQLLGDNRNIVIDSLHAVNARQGTVGLNALLDELKLEYATADDYGYKIGPIINASGRLYDDGPMKVFELLSIDDKKVPKKDLKKMAKALIKVNAQRQNLVSQFDSLAMNQIVEKGFDKTGSERKHKFAVIYDSHFHEGINGIVAGHATELLNMPCAVFSPTSNPHLWKGSGRSIDGVNLKALLDQVSDLFIGYGGHAGAAGMSIDPVNLPKLQEAMDNLLADVDEDKGTDALLYDFEIQASDLDSYIDKVNQFAPYGEGNPPLTFKVDGFHALPKYGSFYRTMGKQKEHVKIFGTDYDAVLFDLAQRYLDDNAPRNLNLLGHLSQNHFRGKITNQVEVLDYAPIPYKHKEVVYRDISELINH